MTKKIKKVQGQAQIVQLQHLDEASAQTVTEGVLVPGKVVPAATDTSAAGVLVGKGSLIRVQVSADTYVAFGASDIGAVAEATSPGLKLASGYYLIRATDDYFRSSADVTRLEILSEN